LLVGQVCSAEDVTGECRRRVNLDRTGEDHSAMNFRIALEAHAASVNFAH